MLVGINVPGMDKMPTTCIECPLVLLREWHEYCAVTDKSVMKHTIDQTKPNWCPLVKVDGVIHDLYASYYYEDESLCELFYKPRVDVLGIDVSDVHF